MPSSVQLQTQEEVEHGKRRQHIVEQVKELNAKGITDWRVFHGFTNSTRNPRFDSKRMVDTSELNHVVRIGSNDMMGHFAEVESNVSMELLVTTTLEQNLMPRVVPEFRAITVGGAFCGTGAESSSFRRGLFDSEVLAIDIVTPDGKYHHAKRAALVPESKKLFESVKGTMGTMGIVTLLWVKLVPSQDYVELKYLPTRGLEGTIQRLRAEIEHHDNDFVDAIQFSPDKGVVMIGFMTDGRDSRKAKQKQLPITTFSRATDEWFYLHAEKCCIDSGSDSKGDKNNRRELVPVADYLFRYDRGAFWAGKTAFGAFQTPFNRLTRILLAPFMSTKRLYEAMAAGNLGQAVMLQDFAMPYDKAIEFVDWINDEERLKTAGLPPREGPPLGDRPAREPQMNGFRTQQDLTVLGAIGALDHLQESQRAVNRFKAALKKAIKRTGRNNATQEEPVPHESDEEAEPALDPIWPLWLCPLRCDAIGAGGGFMGGRRGLEAELLGPQHDSAPLSTEEELLAVDAVLAEDPSLAVDAALTLDGVRVPSPPKPWVRGEGIRVVSPPRPRQARTEHSSVSSESSGPSDSYLLFRLNSMRSAPGRLDPHTEHGPARPRHNSEPSDSPTIQSSSFNDSGSSQPNPHVTSPTTAYPTQDAIVPAPPIGTITIPRSPPPAYDFANSRAVPNTRRVIRPHARMLNIGVWGYGTEPQRFMRHNREIEGKLREIGGIKWLYGRCYYTEEEFWQIYDKDWYDSVRAAAGAQGLPSVWDKIRPTEIADISRRDALKAWVGRGGRPGWWILKR